MGKPLSFETVITKKRLAEEVEDIESEIGREGFISDTGRRKIRELRLALESSKPLIGDKSA